MGAGASAKKKDGDAEPEEQGQHDGGASRASARASFQDLETARDQMLALEAVKNQQEALPPADLTGLLNTTGNIADFYSFTDIVLSQTRSAASLVRLVAQRSTKQPRAVKQHGLQIAGVDAEDVRNQALFLKEVCAHPFICTLYEVFQDRISLYEVLEYCDGPRLYDCMVDSDGHTERECATVMQQLLGAVTFMHHKLVCHRNIKPDHILLKQKTTIQDCTVKVVDFSCAIRIKHVGHVMTDRVGTPYYASPQVFAMKYTESCDVWSCGVIFYLLLLGYPSRREAARSHLRGQELLAFLTRGKFVYDQDDLKQLSQGSADLLTKLLAEGEDGRCSAAWAADNEWLQSHAPQELGSRVQIPSYAVGLPKSRSSEFAEFVKKTQSRIAIDEGDICEDIVSKNPTASHYKAEF